MAYINVLEYFWLCVEFGQKIPLENVFSELGQDPP